MTFYQEKTKCANGHCSVKTKQKKSMSGQDIVTSTRDLLQQTAHRPQTYAHCNKNTVTTGVADKREQGGKHTLVTPQRSRGMELPKSGYLEPGEVMVKKGHCIYKFQPVSRVGDPFELTLIWHSKGQLRRRLSPTFLHPCIQSNREPRPWSSPGPFFLHPCLGAS